jgi:hypothetical protein
MKSPTRVTVKRPRVDGVERARPCGRTRARRRAAEGASARPPAASTAGTSGRSRARRRGRPRRGARRSRRRSAAPRRRRRREGEGRNRASRGRVVIEGAWTRRVATSGPAVKRRGGGDLGGAAGSLQRPGVRIGCGANSMERWLRSIGCVAALLAASCGARGNFRHRASSTESLHRGAARGVRVREHHEPTGSRFCGPTCGFTACVCDGVDARPAPATGSPGVGLRRPSTGRRPSTSPRWASTAALDTGVSAGPGALGAACTRLDQCIERRVPPDGALLPHLRGRGGLPTSIGWTCTALPGLGPVCGCTPRGVETCNGLDDDCDGVADNGITRCGGACVDLQTDPSQLRRLRHRVRRRHLLRARRLPLPGLAAHGLRRALRRRPERPRQLRLVRQPLRRGAALRGRPLHRRRRPGCARRAAARARLRLVPHAQRPGGVDLLLPLGAVHLLQRRRPAAPTRASSTCPPSTCP